MELTVLAKRFLAKPEHRIQFDDLVGNEVARVTSQLSDMYGSSGDTRGKFIDWVLRYETASESLVKLAGVVSRWGSYHEHQLMIEAIQTLLSKANARRVGDQNWVELKRYPAALIFYGYGLGLTRAGRLKELYGLMEHLVAYNRLAEVLTPRWSTSFASVGDPAQLYERFELFCLLQFLKHRGVDEESLKESIKKNQFQHYLYGRLRVSSSARKHLYEEMLLPEFRAPVVEAGFGYGSDTYLQTFFDGLQRVTRY